MPGDTNIVVSGLFWRGAPHKVLEMARRRGSQAQLQIPFISEAAMGIDEALGQKKRARSKLENLYAAAPDHKDVAIRLGLKTTSGQGAMR
ncbi:unnamed protein product [marine sediment metagenome]|uniref:Uncharacterized protein n=1 Tax=marine sediment metagenome TaxID=412755 RepID=X0W5V8_9ZZZZ